MTAPDPPPDPRPDPRPDALAGPMAASPAGPPGFDSCEREPIHIPAAILPFGAMLVVAPDTLEVLQGAGELEALLGRPVEALLGHSGAALFRPDQVEHLRALAAGSRLARPMHLLDPLFRVLPGQPLDASLHRTGEALVMEFEAADPADRLHADPLVGVQELAAGLDTSGSLLALCQSAVDGLRRLTGYDRVLAYRFEPDESGWVFAESRAPGIESFLDLHYPAGDIPEQARNLYLANWVRMIPRVDYTPAPLIPPCNPRTGAPLDMSQAVLRDVSPIHRAYLRNMGVGASLSISIILGGRLWGLFACHHAGPRLQRRPQRAICELFGALFSLQLEARTKAELFEERMASRMVLSKLSLNIAAAADYVAGLTRRGPNLLDYIGGGGAGAASGGAAVSAKGQVTLLGTTPNAAQVAALVAWLDARGDPGGLFLTDRLAEVWPEAAGLEQVACGVLAVAVSQEASDWILWFRPEHRQVTCWAGRSATEAAALPAAARLTPRTSFAAWLETRRGRCRPWTAAEIAAARDLQSALLEVTLRRINALTRERKRAADRDRLLMAELDHRVKNTIANIQALVVQTSRSAGSLTEFVAGLGGRIQAMAKAHSLLSEGRWEGVSVDLLLREELKPYGIGQAGVALAGPQVRLTPKAALALSLAVHELATNAAKYGALSRPGGTVAVAWGKTPEGGLTLTWREAGGPAVAPPLRRGFGSSLIERAMAMETGGRAKLSFEPGGVACAVVLPASALARPAPSDAPRPPGRALGAADRPAAPAQAIRILVVEDSWLLVTTLEGILAGLGWEMVGPGTRKAEAMELARTESFDAALLDVNLDDEMSWDVASLLRRRGIPYIFTTGYNIATLLPEELAGSEVLVKPYLAADVERRLQRLIAEARGERAVRAGEAP